MNQAIHTIDLLDWLAGEIVSVQGTASRRALPIETEDTAEMTFDHVGGARSVLYTTLVHAANEQASIDITTEHAHLAIREGLTITYDDGSVESVSDELNATGERSYWGVSHGRLINDFYRCLLDDGPFWITPADCGRLIGAIHDVYASSFPDRK